eukprot:m.161906 g.161906  ORF g.161906 m.161906 type:complete len:65 (-) comp14367_c7_seq1:1104-1298(-)
MIRTDKGRKAYEMHGISCYNQAAAATATTVEPSAVISVGWVPTIISRLIKFVGRTWVIKFDDNR